MPLIVDTYARVGEWYPGRTRNQSIAQGPVSPREFGGAEEWSRMLAAEASRTRQYVEPLSAARMPHGESASRRAGVGR